MTVTYESQQKKVSITTEKKMSRMKKLERQFPIKIRSMKLLVTLCVGLFKSLYFKKYRMILDYIKDDCRPVLDKYSGRVVPTTHNAIPKHIWVLWYDENNIKPVPEACIKRMQDLDGFEVTILTKDCISNYIDISDILPLLGESISIQFFSDVVRARVLRKYGGFWLDSTIAVIDKSFLENIVTNYDFYSIKLIDLPKWCSVSQGKFSSYFWATYENNVFFEYLDDCLSFFIAKHRTIIDYFQIDYTIMVGYENLPFIKKAVDAIPSSNPNVFWMSKRLNDPFDEQKWKSIVANTSIFKLSWRRNVIDQKKINHLTYWQYLLKTWEKQS